MGAVAKPAGSPEPRMSLREEQKRLTRDRIIGAAAEVFEKSSYSRVSVADIAEAAGVNRATFYLHFPGKSEVLTAVMRRLLDATATDYWQSLDKALVSGSRAEVRRWLEHAPQWWLENVGLADAWEEARRVDRDCPELPDTIDEVIDICRELLGRCESDADRAEVRRRIRLLMAQLVQVGRRDWMTDRSHPDHDAYLDSMTDIWCASLWITGP
ncbi:TetR/AcrR family transcriptional regulator [Nocardia salmonicida]